METSLPWKSPMVVERADLQVLFDALQRQGYRLMGPRVREGAIVYDEIASVAELPAGWGDEQEGGRYRLKRRDDGALFGYTAGVQGWKRFLFPPVQRLFSAVRGSAPAAPGGAGGAAPRYALIGVRACELQAITVQDKVFLGGRYVDPTYLAARQNVFILAVQCVQAGATCFCVSMNTGPKVRSGFDLALTEMVGQGGHWFLAEAGTEHGAGVLAEAPHRPASAEEVAAAQQAVQRAATQMGRSLDTEGIKELFYRNYEHPHWDEVASRCLSCANCTLVCPTCFCSTVEDTTDLTGTHAERWRKWDSCFTVSFTHIVGGGVRTSTKSRYRQWLTHKLATWLDQFGVSGCVGCGRCITWCPVGIDLTAETRALRGAASPRPPTA
jgi:ferredoxin